MERTRTTDGERLKDMIVIVLNGYEYENLNDRYLYHGLMPFQFDVETLFQLHQVKLAYFSVNLKFRRI